MLRNTSAATQIDEWIRNSPETVHITKQTLSDNETMQRLHVHKGSYIGEIIGRYTRVSLINGYINLLCGKGEDSITEINGVNEKGMPELFPGALIIAYDIDGNVFALNSGACQDAEMGKVLYLPKISFSWENLEISYAQFLEWILSLKACDLIAGGWRMEIGDTGIKNAKAFLFGKAGAYNMFHRSEGGCYE